MDFAPSAPLRTDQGKISPITSRKFDVQFEPLDGYEPPQGKIVGEGITGSYLLSEDPDDRKDGLWVWGLFKGTRRASGGGSKVTRVPLFAQCPPPPPPNPIYTHFLIHNLPLNTTSQTPSTPSAS